jgi:hypothetical protein
MAGQKRSGKDGYGLTITTNPTSPPDLSDVFDRLKDNRKVWEDLRESFLSNPNTYQKSQRFTDDRMPIPGEMGRGVPPAAPWFGGGYEGRLKLRTSKKRLNVTSNRPFVPFLKSSFVDKIADELVEWWLDGV